MKDSGKKVKVGRKIVGLLLVIIGITIAMFFSPNWGFPQLTSELVANIFMFFVGFALAVVGVNLIWFPCFRNLF